MQRLGRQPKAYSPSLDEYRNDLIETGCDKYATPESKPVSINEIPASTSKIICR